MDDPRVSDEATGLPSPPAQASTITAGSVPISSRGGVLSRHHTPLSPSLFGTLHLRGLIEADDSHEVEWTQVHVAVPIEHAMDVAAVLAGGSGQVSDD